MTSTIAAKPINPWLTWNALISNIQPELAGVATYTLTFDNDEVANGYSFLPGQFNMIYLPGLGEAAISVSGEAVDERLSGQHCGLQHTIREAGSVTQALAKLNEGDSIGLRGPFGSAWPMQDLIGKDIIMVAGGIGMAPLRPVVNEILRNRHRYGNVTLLQGARSVNGLLYSDEIAAWRKSINVQRTIDRADLNWIGDVGVVTALIERMQLPRPKDTVLLTCGPEAMMWFTIRAAVARGLSESSMWVSLERNMNCAVGLCGHCQLGPQFVCKDGPIFRYDQVVKLLQVSEL